MGVTIRTRVNQYSVLRLIQDAWGLGTMGETAHSPVIDGWQDGS